MVPHTWVPWKTVRIVVLTSGNERGCQQAGDSGSVIGSATGSAVVEGSEQDDERLASCDYRSAQSRASKHRAFGVVVERQSGSGGAGQEEAMRGSKG